VIDAADRGRLAVWLNDELVGHVSDRTMGFVAFDFAEDAVERHGAGSRILSLSMPASRETVDPFAATAFFAGLLPEGLARVRLCEEFRVSPDDPFGLLAVLGRESAGALVIVPAAELPPQDDGDVRPLDEEQLARELARLAVAPLGVTVEDDAVRLSLAGVQDKLPLVLLDDGTLALPLRGRPSTHIAKPDRGDERYPELAANEAFCLAVADELGVPTAGFSTLTSGATPVLLVERYDRLRDGGRIVRLHQEDACQATATNPAFKYEGTGGPSLAAVADLLDEHSSQPGIDRTTLLRLTFANVVLGNCDAHGKNLSFLHAPGGVRLAPAYDIVSTQAYAHTDELGMRVGDAARLRDVTRASLLDQAGRLGLPQRLAERVLSTSAERLPDALEAARGRVERAGWASAVVERISAATLERLARLAG
jgi:serine/threonine-protein kinase HipA